MTKNSQDTFISVKNFLGLRPKNKNTIVHFAAWLEKKYTESFAPLQKWKHHIWFSKLMNTKAGSDNRMFKQSYETNVRMSNRLGDFLVLRPLSITDKFGLNFVLSEAVPSETSVQSTEYAILLSCHSLQRVFMWLAKCGCGTDNNGICSSDIGLLFCTVDDLLDELCFVFLADSVNFCKVG